MAASVRHSSEAELAEALDDRSVVFNVNLLRSFSSVGVI